MKKVLLLILLMTVTLLGQSLEEKVKRIYLLTQMEFSSAILEQERDTKLHQIQDLVKDEFETQALFEKRKADTDNRGKDFAMNM